MLFCFVPLPYKNSDRLVILWNRSPGLNVEQDWFSPGQYLDIRAENKVFDEVAVTIDGSFNLTGQSMPERVEGARVFSSLFPLLGAQAMLGRVFTPERGREGKCARDWPTCRTASKSCTKFLERSG
jgi:hypothetical protein